MIDENVTMNWEFGATHDKGQVWFSVNVSPLGDGQLLRWQRLRRQARRLQRQRRLFALPDVRVSLAHPVIKFQGEINIQMRVHWCMPFNHVGKHKEREIFLLRMQRNEKIW
jgi:hypothetical protein